MGFSDLNLVPEALRGPIRIKIEVADIDVTPSSPQLLHAIQAFATESKPAYMFLSSFAMPGAADPFNGCLFRDDKLITEEVH
jgi:hypothetical protein